MPKILKQCDHCSSDFSSYESKQRRFCCLKCKHEHKKIIINCPCCKLDFQVTTTRQKTTETICCSIACRVKLKVSFMTCAHCGKNFQRPRSSRRFCSASCVYDYRKSNNIPGRWMENGYVVIYSGDGEGIKEHVHIMETKINRKLKRNEVVHHINGIRDDNRAENLQLMTNSEHSRLHRQQELAAGKKLF